jgi:hypothetical protein
MDPNYGYANQLSSFDDDFQQLGLGAKRPEATFVMDLLPGVVGWIIGRSGTRIKEIQLQSGCKMVGPLLCFALLYFAAKLM